LPVIRRVTMSFPLVTRAASAGKIIGAKD